MAPFSEKAVKVHEHDEFVGDFEQPDLDDDTDLFEDFTLPPPRMAASSPMKVTFKAQPKNDLNSGAAKIHFSSSSSSPVVPFTNIKDSPTFKPNVQYKSDSSSGGSGDERSDSSSDYSTDSDPGRQSTVHKHPTMSGSVGSFRKNSINPTPIRAVNKFKTRSKLGNFSSPAQPPAAARSDSVALTNNPATRSPQNPSSIYVTPSKNTSKSERPRDPISRAERLLSLADDSKHSTSLYNVKSNYPK